MFEIKFLVFLFLVIISLIETNALECNEPYCHCNDLELICDNFTSFAQLDICSNNRMWEKIHFYPLRSLQLNGDLKLERFRLTRNASLFFSNIDSFYIFSGLFQRLHVYDENEYRTLSSEVKVVFKNSNVSFSIKSRSKEDIMRTDKFICDSNEFTLNHFIFSNLSLATISFQNCYFDELCPVVFHDTNLYSLEFHDIKSTPKYPDIFYYLALSLNIEIKVLKIIKSGDSIKGINRKILINTILFEKVVEIYISDTNISYIDADTIDYLKYLKRLDLKRIGNLDNQTIFTHTKWLDILNQRFDNENYDYDNVFGLFIEDFSSYLQNERSICIFQHFSQNSLVLPIFNPEKSICNCNIYWLYRRFPVKSYRIGNSIVDPFINIKECIMKDKDALDNLFQKCYFETKFTRCNSSDCLEPLCFCDSDAEKLVCDLFESFKELDFTKNDKIWKSITFNPLKLTQLSNFTRMSKINIYNEANLTFSNLESIFVYSNFFHELVIHDPQRRIIQIDGSVNIEFKNSIIRYFPDSTDSDSLVNYMKSYLKCDLDEWNEENFIFSRLKIGKLKFTNVAFESSLAVCPLIFHNIKIENFIVYNSFGRIKYSKVNFNDDQANQTIITYINAISIHLFYFIVFFSIFIVLTRYFQ